MIEFARALLLAGSATLEHESSSSPESTDSEQSTPPRNEERSHSQVSSALDDGVNMSSTGGRKPKMPEKRVSNLKLKECLGVVLRFPTYREGLRAIHSGDQSPFD